MRHRQPETADQRSETMPELASAIVPRPFANSTERIQPNLQHSMGRLKSNVTHSLITGVSKTINTREMDMNKDLVSSFGTKVHCMK